MSALRQLPPNPSLEYERKEAKALLRLLRAGDADAVARARAQHPRLAASAQAIRLADAQLVIAREYGFTSWPRLVRYFEAVNRQCHNPRPPHLSHLEQSVRNLLAQHKRRRGLVGRTLASFVPRFYGLPLADIYAADVSEDDARLAVARENGYPSWARLLEQAEIERASDDDDAELSPVRKAAQAIAAADLEALQHIAAAHPELLHPNEADLSVGRSLMSAALAHERRLGAAALHPIMTWLEEQGLDVQPELDRELCGRMRMPVDTVHWLLERGANPNAIAPNGIPVLEHALVRYWNGDAVDVLAAHAKPRKALWIAAGLGDLEGVRRSLDANGNPTPAARRIRPDFVAVWPGGYLPQHPEPSDEEIMMETLVVAMFNGRAAVIEYLASRGFPLNSLIYDSPIINVAVGNAWTSVVECLVRCGADLDLPGWHPNNSARELAREYLEEMPRDPERRRIAEICGLDPDAILAGR